MLVSNTWGEGTSAIRYLARRTMREAHNFITWWLAYA